MSPDIDEVAAARGDDWGPTASGGRGRRPRRRLVLRSILVVVLALLLVYAGAGVYASSKIDRVPVEGVAGPVSTPFHVLVIGSDSRSDLSAEERKNLTTGSAEGERADTIFVMTVGLRGTALLAFPRDLEVTRCDGTRGRINAAIGIGGPGCLLRTVRDVSGIPLAGYVEVRFLGFRDIVDAVGGVEVCLDRPIADRDAGIDLPAGCQALDGAQALGYVRVRKLDDDLQRIKRQQSFMRALAGEMLSPGVLLNPLRLYRTAGQAGEALVADEGFGAIDLSRMGFGMLRMAMGAATTHTVPVGAGRSSLPLDEAEAEPLFASFRDGSVLGGEESGLTPAQVTVSVLNGSGVNGLASRTAEALRALDFEVGEVGNADPSPRTVILHPPTQRAAAELVAVSLPVRPELVADTSVSTVTVVLGSDSSA